jgi:hypothetical protein
MVTKRRGPSGKKHEKEDAETLRRGEKKTSGSLY